MNQTRFHTDTYPYTLELFNSITHFPTHIFASGGGLNFGNCLKKPLSLHLPLMLFDIFERVQRNSEGGGSTRRAEGLYKGSLCSLMLIEGRAGWWSFPECDCERIESTPSKLLKWPQCLPAMFFLANLDCDISGRNSCYFRQNSENSVISVNIWEDLSNLDKTRK